MGPVLELNRVTKRFGGLSALDTVSFSVGKGDVLGIIGPNGAGKTTLFNIICGTYAPDSGKIIHNGADITKRPVHDVARRGIVRTFQLATIFPGMSVQNNIEVACYLRRKPVFVEEVLWRQKAQTGRDEVAATADRIMNTVGLRSYASETARNLSYGYKKALSVGIALAAGPELLLLDEPVAGMNANEVDRMLEILLPLNKEGLTLVIVEHNIRAIMRICKRIVALNFGKKIAEGTPEEIRHDEAVIQAYLGRD
jgi:branched-chain amino acid transport system ATP-binding protein